VLEEYFAYKILEMEDEALESERDACAFWIPHYSYLLTPMRIATSVQLVIWYQLLQSQCYTLLFTFSCPVLGIADLRSRTYLSRARLRFREMVREVRTYWREFLLAFVCDVCRVSN